MTFSIKASYFYPVSVLDRSSTNQSAECLSPAVSPGYLSLGFQQLSCPPFSLQCFLVTRCFQGNSLGLWLCVILWGFCPLLCSLGPGVSDFSLHSWNTVYEHPRQKEQRYCGMDVGMKQKSGTGWHLSLLGSISMFVFPSESRTIKEMWTGEVYAFEFVYECFRSAQAEYHVPFPWCKLNVEVRMESFGYLERDMIKINISHLKHYQQSRTSIWIFALQLSPQPVGIISKTRASCQ